MRRLSSRKHLSIDTNYDHLNGASSRSFRRRCSSDDSIALESFSIKTLRHESPFKIQLEQLIDYLSTNASSIAQVGESIHNFERIVIRTLSEQHEPSLLRLLKGFGWTGQRFHCSEDSPLDTTTLLQALSNLYLKFRNIQSSILPSSVGGPLGAVLSSSPAAAAAAADGIISGGIGGVEQVLPFCPDILFDFLAQQSPEVDKAAAASEVPCVSFTGACMLVDISGFSKFSGAMCSKGVTGLDELRKATNGFLGHFVKTVYEYNGDVVAFAGDALLCVFPDKNSAHSSHTGPNSIAGSFSNSHRDSGRRLSAMFSLSAEEEEHDKEKEGKEKDSEKTAATAAGLQMLSQMSRNPSGKSDFGTGSHISEMSVNSSNSCYRALCCASLLRNHQTGSLSTHIGVSYGQMKMALLGGYNGQWIYLMNGACVSELSSCIEDAKAQQVVATEDCYTRALEVYMLAADQQQQVRSPTVAAAGALLLPSTPQQQSMMMMPPTPTTAARSLGALPPKAPTRQSSILKSKDGIGAWSSASSDASTNHGNDGDLRIYTVSKSQSQQLQLQQLPRYAVQFEDPEGAIPVEEEGEDDFVLSAASADSDNGHKLRSVRFGAASSDSCDLDDSAPLPHQQFIRCRRSTRASSNVLVESMAAVPKYDSCGNLYTQGDTSPNELGRVGFIQRMTGLMSSNNAANNANTTTAVSTGDSYMQYSSTTAGTTNASKVSVNSYSSRQQRQQQEDAIVADDDDREILEEETRLGELTVQQLSSRTNISATAGNVVGAAATAVGDKDDTSSKHLSIRELRSQLALQRQEHLRKYVSIRSVESYNSSTFDSSEHDRETEQGFRTQQALLQNVAMFVPIPVLASLRYESLDHVGELRTVTTMFLSLDSYSPTRNSDPTTLQPFFLLAQEALFTAGGFLRQFLVDDKGCVLIAMWGVPSFTYANNCCRALHCAVQILLQSAEQLESQCSIGITTGNVFCGSVGCAERRDYAGIGTDVNMAARLMGKAHGRVLLDDRTYENLPQDCRVMLQAAEAMLLKGNINAVTPFQFIGSQVPPMASLDENIAGAGNSKLLKKNITQLLCSQLDKIANNVASSIQEARMMTPMGRADSITSAAARRSFNYTAELRNASLASAGNNNSSSRPMSLPRTPLAPFSPSGLGLYESSNFYSSTTAASTNAASNRPISLPRTPASPRVGLFKADSVATSNSGFLSRKSSHANLLLSPRGELRLFSTVHFTVLQGQAGTGKSTASEYFRIEARKRGLHVVYIKAESAHRAEPYGVVRDIFFDIVGLPRPSTLSAENCTGDYLASINMADAAAAATDEAAAADANSSSARRKKKSSQKKTISVVESVREKITQQVDSMIKSLVRSAYDDSSAAEIQAAIESVRNVLGLPRDQQQQQQATPSSKDAAALRSSKASASAAASGPMSVPKPKRTGSLLSTKGMSFSFGSMKASQISRIDSSDDGGFDSNTSSRGFGAAAGAAFDLNDFPFQHGSSAPPREAGDLAFYKVLAVLLRNTPTALVVENAHNCDELSWQELLIILMGFDLEMAILVTIRQSNSSGLDRVNNLNDVESLLENEEAPHSNFTAAAATTTTTTAASTKAIYATATTAAAASTKGKTAAVATKLNTAAAAKLNTAAAAKLNTAAAAKLNTAAAVAVDSKESTSNFSSTSESSPLQMPAGSFKNFPKLAYVATEVKDFNASFIINMPSSSSIKGTAATPSSKVVFNASPLNAAVASAVAAAADSENSTTGTADGSSNNNSGSGSGELGFVNFSAAPQYEVSEAFQAICSHSNCVVKTMTGLKEDGVRHYLLHSLRVSAVSRDLVKTVFRISGGNFCWIRSIVMFIKERGVEMFEEAIKHEETNESALRALIIYRIGDLQPSVQLVLRYASIVGHEFSERLLSSIVPSMTPRSSSGNSTARSEALIKKTNQRLQQSKSEKMQRARSGSMGASMQRISRTRTGSGIGSSNSIGIGRISGFGQRSRSGKASVGDINSAKAAESSQQLIAPALEVLTKLGFFSCVREHPVALFEFQNEFVHATVYEMIPPSDAAMIHTAIAQFLELQHADNLVPYYPRLGFHYKHGVQGRVKAFKYELKAASHCMSRGAFSDALMFIDSASDLAEEKREYKVLLDVINYGLKTLGVRQGCAFTSLYSLLSRALTKNTRQLDGEEFYFSDSLASHGQFPEHVLGVGGQLPPPTYSSINGGGNHRSAAATPHSRGIAEHSSNEVSSQARTIDAYKRIKLKVERKLSDLIKQKRIVSPRGSGSNFNGGALTAPARGGSFSPRNSFGSELVTTADAQLSWAPSLRSQSKSGKAGSSNGGGGVNSNNRKDSWLAAETIDEHDNTQDDCSGSGGGDGNGFGAEAGSFRLPSTDGRESSNSGRFEPEFNSLLPSAAAKRGDSDGCGVRCSCIIS